MERKDLSWKAGWSVAKAALALCDESTAGPYVTGAALRLPSANLDAAAQALSEAKQTAGVPADARIHCRVLFHPDARRKSPFKDMKIDDVHALLVDCTTRMNALGASWSGAWVDKQSYPKELQLVDGEKFLVTPKHLAGILCLVAATDAKPSEEADVDFAYDADRTMIDWGLAKRTQASNFLRIQPNAVELPEAHKPLLEMADVAAYALAQSKLFTLRPDDRKLRRVSALPTKMGMDIKEFFWSLPQAE